MYYVGSKSKHANSILSRIMPFKKDLIWVEPFVGGANMIENITGQRIGADSNEYLIEFWQKIQSGWIPKQFYTYDEYGDIKNNQDRDKAETAYVSINCSFQFSWWNGYNGHKTNEFQKLAFNNLMLQIPKIKDVTFIHTSYDKLDIPENSIIYCDPPYRGTKQYKDSFNHELFDNWCIEQVNNGRFIFISEYSMPKELFTSIWKKKVAVTIGTNRINKPTKQVTEHLFIPNILIPKLKIINPLLFY